MVVIIVVVVVVVVLSLDFLFGRVLLRIDVEQQFVHNLFVVCWSVLLVLSRGKALETDGMLVDVGGDGGRDKKNEGMGRVWHPQAKEMQQGRNERTNMRVSERTNDQANERGWAEGSTCVQSDLGR